MADRDAHSNGPSSPKPELLAEDAPFPDSLLTAVFPPARAVVTRLQPIMLFVFSIRTFLAMR
jgi:hypothetical protein